ncbi:hypothetical protein BDR26DRAFT_929795 [Obelidium mucronatum]|nr:hypothetical protein BDR26DRAFT_929795 [Obelidium mucronatum]
MKSISSFEIDYEDEDDEDEDEEALFPDDSDVLGTSDHENRSSDIDNDDDDVDDGSDVVFMGSRRISRRLMNDEGDDDIQVIGARRRPVAVNTEDADAELARRLQEEEFSAIQSSNVEQNIQQLFGILDQDSEDETPQEHGERTEALELLQQQQTGRGRPRRSNATRNQIHNDAFLAAGPGLTLGGLRGRGRMYGLMNGLIPDLYGAGVAYNPANYVDDDNFDTSYESLISLGERIGTAKPKGVTKTILNSLPSKKYQPQGTSSGSSSTNSQQPNQDDTRCAICLTEFDEGEDISGVPCLHWFHGECIKRWLTTSTVCPM